MTDTPKGPDRPGERPGRLRASDGDRDRTVERLRRHHEEGRLDATEFEERMSAALSARYCDELPPLLADLPSDRDADATATPPWLAHGRLEHLLGSPGWQRLHGLPVLALAALLVLMASLGAVVHGHFPLPLLIGALVVWKLRSGPTPWRVHRPQRG